MDAAALAVAAALLVVGVAAVVVRRWRLGVTALIVGMCLPGLGYSDHLNASNSLGIVVAVMGPLLAPLAAWACVRPTAPIRLAVAAGVVAGPLRTLVYDPFYDPTCITECTPNPLAIAHLSSAANAMLWTASLVAAAALTRAALVGPHRLVLTLLAASAWLVGLAPARYLEAATIVGGVLLAVGGATVAGAFEARARVDDLARALQGAGDVEATLRSAVGDPSITVAYQLEADEGLVDRDGQPANGPAPGQVSTAIVGADGVVAMVRHDPAVTDLATLAAAITGPARLAIENGRLAATVSRHAHALEASRRRIVVQADTERRKLERDLHDGAQQHVLALGLALRTAMDHAGETQTRNLLDRCLASTHVVLDELRDLSHGFYPASLAQTGLGNALDGVVDRAPAPVSITNALDHRVPAEIERAIYLLVSRLAAAARRPLEVAITTSRNAVEVTAVGAEPPADVLADVFAVLGGTLRSELATPGGNVPVVRGTLPLHNRSGGEVA